MNVRHVIFDLDGTLVDSAVHCAAILSEMLEERGSSRRVTRAEAMPQMSYGGHHLVTTLLGEECGDGAAEVIDFRARYAARPTPETCIYAGVRAGLRDLAARGFTLAVCSNKPQGLCDKVLDDLGLRPFLSSVVGGRPELAAKPHPAMIERNLADMGASAATTLLVGDSEVDQAAAVAAGIPFWLVGYGYPGADWTPVADARFDSFPAVVAALAAPGRRRARA